MKNFVRAFFLALPLCLLLTAGIYPKSYAAQEPELKAAAFGEKAPAFTISDSNGKNHALSDFQGKIVVLEWTNFGCPFVGKHYNSANMQRLQKKYTHKGIIWLAICSSRSGRQGYMSAQEINKKLTEENASPSFYLIDADGKVGRAYGAKSTPTMCIIDKEGKIAYFGGIDDKPSTDIEDIVPAHNYVQAALDEMLAGKPVTKRQSPAYGCSVKY